MQLKQLSEKFKTELSALYQEDEAQALFLLTLHHFLNFNRADYLLKKDKEISSSDLLNFEQVLMALITGKPIQYILGETYFYGLPFKVNPSVLIPRPETEELVEWIISVCSSQFPTDSYQDDKSGEMVNRQSSIKNILDIGTGSGCIAISLKKHLSSVKVYALDIAKDTLAIAKQNATLNNVDVAFIEDDILNSQNAKLNAPYSIIVSNPPYIKEDEKLEMHHNVLANEPHRALFVSNENPLVFYEAIANFALQNLKDNGMLFFEINEYLGQETINLLKHKGFKNIELRKDMQGKDRMISATISDENE